jgi:hypothetical protein
MSPKCEANPQKWRQVYLAVGLTTLATLILELSLTRIFSVIFFYHFAFLAISVALFGLGIGGGLSYLMSQRSGNMFSKLGILAASNSLAVVATLVFVLSLGSDLHISTLTVVYFVNTVPFLFAGAVLSTAITLSVDRVDRVYFCDLLGAAAGCLLLIPLLNSLGGPSTMIAAGALYAGSSIVWFDLAGTRSWRVASLGLSAALALLTVINAKNGFIDVRYAKGRALHNEVFVKWNSFSRIGINQDHDNLMIQIDEDAATTMVTQDPYRLLPSAKRELLSAGPGLPYLLHPAAKTLIIGPGGGMDVFRALVSGSKDVTGVEINPIIATDIMRSKFTHETNGLYLRPEVRIFVEDGRSFVRRSREKYQVLQATLVDTWASTAAGAFALSENNLYTVEAFQDYLQRLTDDGLLAFTRWGFNPPRESLRLLSLAIEALGRLGEREPRRHFLVVREDPLNSPAALDTVLVFRKPLPADQVARFRTIIQALPMKIVYMPGDPPSNQFGEMLLSPEPARFQMDYAFDVSPTTDNRPFFFYTTQPRDVWGLIRSYLYSGWRHHAMDDKVNLALPILYGVLLVSLIATSLMVVVPRLFLGNRWPREKGVLRFLLFFVAIGVGYILIEVALIQKFIVFLGQPTYALAVIIFSMLVFSGIGSYLSPRLVKATATRLQFVLGAVAFLVALLAVMVPAVTATAMGLSLVLRASIAVGMIAPAAFFMGMPFPTGLKLLEHLHSPSLRWAWSLNAAASVLGSASAIFLAIYLGLRETMLIGGMMYLAALAPVYLGIDHDSRHGKSPVWAEVAEKSLG